MFIERFVGIDIGGTNTRLAYSPSLDNPAINNKKIFPNSHNFEEDYQEITEYIDSLEGSIEGIGVGIPGTLDKDKLMVMHAKNISGYVGKPIPELLKSRYQCNVNMDNDASVAALGEAIYGNGGGRDFLLVIWGTGIGGAKAAYQEGKPLIYQLNWTEYFSTWEKECGGRNMQKLYGKLPESLSEEEWKKVMDGFLKQLKVFVDKLKPKRIIFTGGISIKQATRLKQLKTRLGKQVLLETSALGENSGIYGALALLK